MIALSALEQDALTEIFNIGVGVAAEALYQMGGEHVPLSVPVVELTSLHDATNHYVEREKGPLCVVRQTYSGEFSTDAFLMFPQENSLELVRLMAGSDLPPDELAAMTQDAMAEIGNIILNAVISNLSSTLHLPLEGSLPSVTTTSADRVFSQGLDNGSGDGSDGPMLALLIDFELSTRQVRGYLAFLLDMPSSEQLGKRLAEYVNGH